MKTNKKLFVVVYVNKILQCQSACAVGDTREAAEQAQKDFASMCDDSLIVEVPFYSSGETAKRSSGEPVKRGDAYAIISSLELFNKLERKNTDEIGWIAFRYSCTRRRAQRMIEQARLLMAQRAKPVEK